MADELTEVMSAGMAAERLGVSPSGLRRLAIIYTSVHDELPREPKTNNRVWPVEAVTRLEQARALVEAESYHSIKEALEALDRGEPVDLPDEAHKALSLSEASARELLGVLIGETRAMCAELGALHRDNEQLRSKVEALATPALPSAPETPQAAPTGLLVRVAMWLEKILKTN